MTVIFISHSTADNAAAAEMKRWLEGEGHKALFLDFDPEMEIQSGTPAEQTLYRKLRQSQLSQCQAVVVLLTPSWLASRECAAELAQARERGKAIFLVKVRICDASKLAGDTPLIDLTIYPREGYRRLRIGLLGRELDPSEVFDWDPERPPYPGLTAFQQEDAAVFFGRRKDILKTLGILDALRRKGDRATRLLLMLGDSGSGKSSLIRAGIIPRLSKKPAEWLPVPPFRPRFEPIDELARALATAFETHGQPRDWNAIRAELHAEAEFPENAQLLQQLVQNLATAAGRREATVLLTIDQAEELFGYCSPEAATRFLRLLRGALETGNSRLLAVATLRSDFLDEFQSHPVLQGEVYPHPLDYRTVPVDPLPQRNFPEIIQGPARLAGLRLSDGLVEAMLADADRVDALPLLAFTLRRLYEREGHDGRLSVDGYETLGRLKGGLAEETRRIVAEIDPGAEALEALRATFISALVRVNAEGNYAYRWAWLDELPGRAQSLLRGFVDARLMTSDIDSEGRETLELSHDVLLRIWPQLSAWLAEDQDQQRSLEDLKQTAMEWEQGGRREGRLLHRDERLREAEDLLVDPRFAVSETSIEREYLSACRAVQEADEATEKQQAVERAKQEQRKKAAEQLAKEQREAAIREYAASRAAADRVAEGRKETAVQAAAREHAASQTAERVAEEPHKTAADAVRQRVAAYAAERIAEEQRKSALRRQRRTVAITLSTLFGVTVTLAVAGWATWRYVEARRESQRADDGSPSAVAGQDHSLDRVLRPAAEPVGAAPEAAGDQPGLPSAPVLPAPPVIPAVPPPEAPAPVPAVPALAQTGTEAAVPAEPSPEVQGQSGDIPSGTSASKPEEAGDWGGDFQSRLEQLRGWLKKRRDEQGAQPPVASLPVEAGGLEHAPMAVSAPPTVPAPTAQTGAPVPVASTSVVPTEVPPAVTPPPMALAQTETPPAATEKEPAAGFPAPGATATAKTGPTSPLGGPGGKTEAAAGKKSSTGLSKVSSRHMKKRKASNKKRGYKKRQSHKYKPRRGKDHKRTTMPSYLYSEQWSIIKNE